MIYEKNKYFVAKGKAFAIGDEVICNDAGDLDGLTGIITQIKTKNDCVFPEDAYEIIVDMISPENPNIQRRIINYLVCEGQESLELAEEYDLSEFLKGVVFTDADSLELYDRNVKALKPYSCAPEVEPLKAYIVTSGNDFGEDNAVTTNTVCYSSLKDAKTAFYRAVAVAQETYREWLTTSENVCVTVSEDVFFASTDCNYIQVALTVADMSINPEHQRLLSQDYDLFYHTKDVREKLYDKWRNGDISDEDYCRLYEEGEKVAESVEDAYDDNECRGDCFNQTLDYIIDQYIEQDA